MGPLPKKTKFLATSLMPGLPAVEILNMLNVAVGTLTPLRRRAIAVNDGIASFCA